MPILDQTHPRCGGIKKKYHKNAFAPSQLIVQLDDAEKADMKNLNVPQKSDMDS